MWWGDTGDSEVIVLAKDVSTVNGLWGSAACDRDSESGRRLTMAVAWMMAAMRIASYRQSFSVST
jgi:hypothetical protein